MNSSPRFILFRHKLLLLGATILSLSVPWHSVSAQTGEGISSVFALDTLGVVSRGEQVSPTFALDTLFPSPEGETAQAFSPGFPLDTRPSSGAPVRYAIAAKDAATGAPLPGVRLVVRWFAHTYVDDTTDASGTYLTGPLINQHYLVVAMRPGYSSRRVRVAPGVSGITKALTFYMEPKPQLPDLIPTDRTVPDTAFRPEVPPSLANPLAPRLLVFDPLTNEFSATKSLLPTRMTIVMSHGWNSSPDGKEDSWPRLMARSIYEAHALGAEVPNIVAWDWRHQAEVPLVPPVDEAPLQGEYLAKELQERLGTNYGQPLHFIGHSLGTLLNKSACDYLHGNRPRISGNPAVPWDLDLTQPHMTLLDEAELASVAGQSVTTSATLGWMIAGVAGGLLTGVDALSRDWKSPIPVDYSWIDNYISMIGLQHSEAVNVCLTAPALGYWNVKRAHGYSYEWYRNSVLPSAQSPEVGWGLAREAGGMLPASGNGLGRGALWYELPTAAPLQSLLHDPTALPFDCPALIWSVYSAKTAAIVNSPEALVVLYADDVAAVVGSAAKDALAATAKYLVTSGENVVRKAGAVRVETVEKIGIGLDAFLDGTKDFVERIDPTADGPKDFSLGSFTTIWMANSQAAGLKYPRDAAGAGAGGAGVVEPRSWITVTLPPDAGLLAFDFKVTGEPAQDCVVCAIEGQNLFSLPLRMVPDDTAVSTDLMDVSAYAGQTVEIMFALSGGTSTNAELGIDGLRYLSVPEPKLTGDVTEDGQITLEWPAAATGWLLETSDELSPDSWQPVNTDTATIQDGNLRLSQLLDRPKRFYRLVWMVP